MLLACVGTFMLILDVTVVNVALPDMERSLHAQLTDLEWVVDAYSLAIAALLLVSGRLSDLIGRKKTFMAGLLVFTAGSLWSSLSGSVAELIAGRVVQGAGGAALFASVLALVGHEPEGPARRRALGAWGAAIGAGLAVGPLVGGLLTDGFGWSAIFLVNVPIGVVMLVASWRGVPEAARSAIAPPDWVGSTVFALALFLLVFGLVEGNRLGWSSAEIAGSLVVSLALLALFARLSRREGAILDIALLRDPRFLASTIAVIGQGVVIAAVLLYLVRDLQETGHLSALAAGLEILPMTVTAFGAAILGGRFAASRKPAFLLAGSLLLLAGGTALMTISDPAGGWATLLPGLFLAGAGWGSVNPIAAHASLEAAGPGNAGMAAGFNNTARQIGIAGGIGGLGAAFQARTASVTAGALRGVGPALAQHLGQAVAQSGVPGSAGALAPRLRAELSQASAQGMTSGLHLVELLGAAAGLLSAVLVLVVGAGAGARALDRRRGEPSLPEPVG